MFNPERFIEDCRTALGADDSHAAVRQVVARAVSEPGAVLGAVGEPERAQLQTLHRSADLTILNVIWAPGMVLLPHDHRMWAVIGIYTGREDNVFWRRVEGESGKVEAVGAREGRAAARAPSDPLGDQSDPPPHRRHPRVRRRLLRCSAE